MSLSFVSFTGFIGIRVDGVGVLLTNTLLAGKLVQAEQRIAQLEAELQTLRVTRITPDPSTLPPPSSILESITDAFIALDREFRFVWANAEAERLTGLPREQMLGHVIWELFPQTIGSALEREARRALSDQQSVEFENYYAPLSRWYWNKAYPTRDGGLAVYWRDITAQKLADLELQRQAHILRQVHDFIITTDLNGAIQDWNRGAEQITGYPASEVIGRHISLLYFEEDRADVGTRVLGPLLQLGHLELEVRNQHKSGREFFLRLSLSLLRDEAGAACGMIGVAADITDQRLAERALRDSEELYRCLAEAMPHIAYTTGPDGKTQFVNQHWREFSGIAPERCLDFDWMTWIHPEDAPALMKLWLECVRTGALFQTEYRLRSSSGQYRWQLSRAVPVRSASSQITQWVGTLTDIHDRKSAEDALRLSEERFRLAVQAFEGLVYDWDLHSGAVQRIGSLESFIGVSAHEAAPDNQWWRQRIHPDDVDRIYAAINAFLASGQKIFQTEYRLLHAHRGWINVCDRAYAVFGPGGTPLRLVGSACDITERQRLEEDVKLQRDRLAYQAAMLAATTDAVIAIDAGHRILYCNPAAERFYGFESQDVLGQSLSDVISYLWLRPEDEQVSRLALDSSGSWSGENIHVSKNGVQTVVHSTVSVLPLELGGGRIAVIRDVSDRKREENDLARKAAQLARSNDDLLHFAFAVSHDLQTPLRTISSFSQLLALRNQGRLDGESDEFIRWIVDAAGRMGTMLRDLVHFAQATGGDIASVGEISLAAALNTALENLRGQLEECGAVITHNQLPAVSGELGKFAAVFQNLVGNSLKYRKPGIPPKIHISAGSSGDNWLISVSDNGIGFEPQYAQRIFGVFQRLHQDDYAGTGIGLAICKRIIERYDGQIWATATPGQGAVFSFLIPAPKSGDVDSPPSPHHATASLDPGHSPVANPVSRERVAFDRHFDEFFQVLDYANALVRRLDGSITTWTTGCQTLFGWAKQEALGRKVGDLLKTVYPNSVGEIEAELLKNGTWTGELRKSRKDGQIVRLGAQWFLYRDGSGRPQSVVEVFNDITELRTAEEALLRGIEQRDLALRAGKMGVWHWDHQTGVVDWAETIEQMLGMIPGSFERTFEAFLDRVHPGDRSGVQSKISAALAAGPEYTVEFRIRRAGGDYSWMHGQGQVHFDSDNQPAGMSGVVWVIPEPTPSAHINE